MQQVVRNQPKHTVKKYVHLSYSRDLRTMGYQSYYSCGTYDAFLLTPEEWKSFLEMYGDWPPTLYDELQISRR